LIVRNKLAVFTLCTVTTLLISPALSPSQSVPPAPTIPVRLAAPQVSPAQVYAKLFSGQEEEVVSAAEAMPADKYNFAPTHGTFEGVRTFAQQVTHIAATQYYYFGNFGIKGGVDPDAIDKLTKKDDIVKALKDSYAFAQQAIETMTAENAFEPIGAHKSTRAGLAAMALAHTNDHYGQMVVYLRMNKIIPPASRKP
jgi:uncharacterized damage-inducible protein DinB